LYWIDNAFRAHAAIQSSFVDLPARSKRGRWREWRQRTIGIALALVLVQVRSVLFSCRPGLLAKLQRMQNASPGFNQQCDNIGRGFVSAGYKLIALKFSHPVARSRPRAPGVESAALTRVTPFSYNLPLRAIEIDGYQPPRMSKLNAEYLQVSEVIFHTWIGCSGPRVYPKRPRNAPPVAIINEQWRKNWLEKDPIGQRLKVKDTWMQIVGVAKNVKIETKLEAPRSFFYVPGRQNFFVGNALLIRTRETPGAITNALAREVHALDPTLAPYAADRLQEQVDGRGYTQRLAATLLAIFGGMALFLAAIGLYGVMSYSVSQGTRELGVRMALGADAGSVLRLVLSRGLRLTTPGIVVGAIAALVFTRLMGNLLYKVSPRDPIAFGAALIVLIAVSLVACFLPARRATRIDPIRALRT
jgi:predicted permease